MITTLKDLKSFLKICRTQGVTEIKIADIEVKIAALPKQAAQEDDDIDSDGPTEEQLMFFSAGGVNQ